MWRVSEQPHRMRGTEDLLAAALGATVAWRPDIDELLGKADSSFDHGVTNVTTKIPYKSM